MLIIPLTDFYATACDWQGARVAPPSGLFLFIAVSFFNGVTLELGRKIRAPGDEEKGVRTYSHLWGYRKATLVWLAALLTTAAFALAASTKIGFLPAEATALALLMGIAIVLAFRFLAKPNTAHSQFLNHFTGIWTLVLYLSLGLIPLLWKLNQGHP
jgi:4-hydroxybenzoate polyprenyltransferase